MEMNEVAVQQHETTFRIIGFGTNKHGFFNNFAFRSNAQAARVAYAGYYQDVEFDGAVVIEVCHESWKVIHEFGTKDVRVVCGPVGNFKVERVSKLELV